MELLLCNKIVVKLFILVENLLIWRENIMCGRDLFRGRVVKNINWKSNLNISSKKIDFISRRVFIHGSVGSLAFVYTVLLLPAKIKANPFSWLIGYTGGKLLDKIWRNRTTLSAMVLLLKGRKSSGVVGLFVSRHG